MENMNENNTETKTCKYCGSQIPKAAKICPNCRKKQKGGVLKFIIIGVVVIIVIAALASSGGSSDESGNITSGDNNTTATGDSQAATDTGEESETTADTEEQAVVHVGDTYDNDGLKITYDEYNSDYTDYEEYFAPSDGNKYIAATFTYENTGDSDEYVDIYEFTCYADNSNAEQVYIGDDPFINTNLSSGRNVSFTVFFEVPKDAKTIELEYSPSFWTDEKVIFECK